MNDNTDTSHFINTPVVQSGTLSAGTVLQVCWAPDRRCHFRHLGNSRYEVVLSENSKLAVGDRFQCNTFYVGMPTYFEALEHLGSTPMHYVIGKRGGISSVSVVAVCGDEGDAKAKAFDATQYLSQRLTLHAVALSKDGVAKGVVPLQEAITNAIRIGLLEFDGHQLFFPADRPERECGFFAHKLKHYYTFSDWSEVDSIIVRRKHDGTIVKTLRQTRSFSPFDSSGLAEELCRQLFLYKTR